VTRPGEGLRRLAARVCTPLTMERLVDPTVADLQIEHANALAAGRFWKARLVRIGGTLCLFRGMCAHVLTAPALRRDREALAIGTAVFAAAVAMTVGPILTAPLRPGANPAELAMFLIPGAAPAALSLAMLCGAAHGLGPAPVDVRSLRRLLAFSLVPALVAFAVAGWIMPAANQAFRLAAAGHPVARGLNELSLGELQALLARATEPMFLVGPRSLRVVHATYHTRLMLACLPVVAAAFGAAVAGRRPIVRALAAIGFLLTYNGYFVVFLHPHEGGALVSGNVPVWLLVWAPNIALAAVSAASIAGLKPRATNDTT
jgi:hypothetical protein